MRFLQRYYYKTQAFKNEIIIQKWRKYEQCAQRHM